MPVFAFTAGSLGDILALIGVVRGLSSSLSSVCSQSGALKELVDDVRLFSRAIDEIKKALDRRDASMHEDVLHGIREHLKICYGILLDVEGRTTAFSRKMVRGRLTMDAVRMYWAVAAWEILGGREAVDKLRGRLRDQISAIQIYLSLAQSCDQGAILATASTQHVDAERIIEAAQDMQRCFGRPAVPSLAFTNKETGLPYAPCARTSVEHAQQLFGCMRFPIPESIVVYPQDEVQRLLNDSSVDQILGRVRTDWDFSLPCLFYRGPFGCFEVFVGVPPQAARTDATDMQSLYRDLVMVGHIDLTRPHAVQASYRTIRTRGDFLNRIVQVYEDLCGEYCKVPWNFNTEFKIAFVAFLKSLPDPEYLETTVLPRMRHLSHIAFEYYDRKASTDGSVLYPWLFRGTGTGRRADLYEFPWHMQPWEWAEWRQHKLKGLNTHFQQVLGLPQPVVPEFQLYELWRMGKECPRLDPKIVAEYKLVEHIEIIVDWPRVTFCDASLDLVRAAACVPNFWDGL